MKDRQHRIETLRPHAGARPRAASRAVPTSDRQARGLTPELLRLPCAPNGIARPSGRTLEHRA